MVGAQKPPDDAGSASSGSIAGVRVPASATHFAATPDWADRLRDHTPEAFDADFRAAIDDEPGFGPRPASESTSAIGNVTPW
jgi:hypothetical protein